MAASRIRLFALSAAVIAAVFGSGFLLHAAAKAEREMSPAWLGARWRNATRDEVASEGFDQARGVRIQFVIPTSPAEMAGLQAGDVILKMDDDAVGHTVGLATRLAARRPGDNIVLGVLRAGQLINIEVALGEKLADPAMFSVVQQAASNGDARAQHYLGVMYEQGKGVAKDIGAAATWFRKSAEQGYAPAEVSLGEAYERGAGVARDFSQAAEWYAKAAAKEDPLAHNHLGYLHLQGRGVEQDDREAFRLFEVSAVQGCAQGQCNLAWLYETGRGTKQDFSKAVEWYTESAKRGNLNAANSLGWMYHTGRGVARDDKKAAQLFQVAAKRGNALAQVNLGLSYFNGQGVERDLQMAARMFALAAAQNNADAENNLGMMRLNGWGMPKNREAAIALFRRAAAHGHQLAATRLRELGAAQTPETATANHNQVAHVDLGDGVTMDLALIPAGEFMMGSRETPEELVKKFQRYGGADEKVFQREQPLHRVRITKPFYLGSHEVTVGQFRQFVKETGYTTYAEKSEDGAVGFNAATGNFEGGRQYSWKNAGYAQGDEHPVVNVVWNDAVAFCEWLSDKTGHTFRLPTEAEWEYACRAGTTTQFYSGDDPEGLAQVANTPDGTLKAKIPNWPGPTISAEDGYDFTAPVGQFKPNAFGLYDMHGNVAEWCSDGYEPGYYAESPVDNPQGPTSGVAELLRIYRGGAWSHKPYEARSAARNFIYAQAFRDMGTGIRVARDLP